MFNLLFNPTSSRHLVLVMSVLFLLTGCQAGLIATPTPAAIEASAETASVDAVEPLLLEQALPPQQVQIPDLALASMVTPMGWTVDQSNDQRTTRWEVPEDSVGWHVTSAGAGGAGRIVLSAHQAVGAAPFAPLAQGQLQPGQEILLTDSEGLVFVYRVTEVSDPIPLTGASPEDEALAASYLEPTTEPLLTLLTGWPDFTTSHRIFAVAQFIGVQP